MFLLDDILLSPLHGVVWLGRKIDEIITKEENDENSLKERLLELQALLELGKIDEEEYRRRETAILERLEEIMNEKEED